MRSSNRTVPAERVPGVPAGDGFLGLQNGFHDGGGGAEPRQLRHYLFILWKYRWLCLFSFALVFGATLATTMLLPRQYMATTTIKVLSQGPIQLKLEKNVLADEELIGASLFTATQVAVLKSRDLAERVLRTHRLTENAAFLRPAETARSGVFEVAGELVGLFRPRGWKPSRAEEAAWTDVGAAVDVPTALIDRYMGYLAVGNVSGTDLIEVRFTTQSPRLSALLAGAHVQAYRDATDEARLAPDVTAREFLQRHVRDARAKLEAAEAALNAFATEHPIVTLNREEKVVAERMAELSSLLTQAQADRVALETRYEFLNDAESHPVDYFLSRPTIQKLRFAQLEVAAEQATIANRLGPNHPRTRDLATQKVALDQRLTAEVAKEISSVDAQRGAARLKEDSLAAHLAQQEEAAVELRNLETAYNLLLGEIESSRSLYASLLERQKETLVNSELTASNIQVVERAEVPTRPAKPNVPLNLVLGALGGLVLAVAGVFLWESLDNSVKSSDEVEELLQLPVLATVPNFHLAQRGLAGRVEAKPAAQNGNADDAPSSALVVYNHPMSIPSEVFRAMRTSILYSAPDEPPQVILVTSTRAAEGKTVTTVNLAAVIGLSGSRVLVIDADLRHPRCHWAFGKENVTGLSSYLTGQAVLKDLAVPVESVANVSLISAGPIPPNPAELLGSERMRTVISWARQGYDFVLLDSAPTLPVTDAVVLAREADGVLFVIKGQDTPRELVRRGRDQLQGVGCRFLGVVVNNVDYPSSDYYYMYSPSAHYDGTHGDHAPPADPRVEEQI